MNNENRIWKFFSSVKLALFTLITLALTSILGTIIPQKETADFYINKYGANTAQFFQLFDITDMYNSWWFLALLGLLSANLSICSIERFPKVWKQIKADNLAIPLDRVHKMNKKATFTTNHNIQDTVSNLKKLLSDSSWKPTSCYRDETNLLFCQKGAWSRTGVYIVHSSILIIFVGAIIGNILGFKGSIMLPELEKSSVIYPFENGGSIDLGFEIRCDRFDIEFYNNGMPKEYRSKLTVLEDGKEISRKDIEVNDPLQYHGITFYQSSYQSFRDFILTITEENQPGKTFTADYQKEVVWPGKNIRFGIINLKSVRDRVDQIKVWFSDGKGAPSEFWMNAGEQVKINREDKIYLFAAKQRYATGLQVAKDPGVWFVYVGCGLMLLGLYMAFFMSHKRVWLLISETGTENTTSILVGGTTNKNKAGFDIIFNDLEQSITKNL